jgi:hypothetical protein
LVLRLLSLHLMWWHSVACVKQFLQSTEDTKQACNSYGTCSDQWPWHLVCRYRECIFIVTGLEFVADEGCFATIVWALYGLKSSGAAWRAHLAQTMYDMNFKLCPANPDVWMHPATKKADNDKKY